MSNDLQYISFADTDTRAMQSMAKAVGDSIDVAGKKIQEGLTKIACSNREIAKAIKEAGKTNANAVLKAGQLIETGLAQIADEMRRKTYMEEYYLLLDRIDSLEDKIVAKCGKKIQEIYDSLGTEYIPPIALSDSEILTMYSCISEETMEWFKMVASMYKVSPWSVFNNILNVCEGMVYYRLLQEPYKVAYYSIHRMPIYYNGCYTEEYADNLSSYSYNRKHSTDNSTTIKCSVEFVKKKFDDLECLSLKQLELVNNFNTFINAINVEIMMENLRQLHTQLREVYRQMK